MKYRIAFFTEGNFTGKYPPNHPNGRTDVAWQIALDAVHFPMRGNLPNDQFDIGIVILPKKTDKYDISYYKQCCTKVGVMQEGPNWLWQDLSMDKQVQYFNCIQEADFILCHNLIDMKYYRGLCNDEKPVYKMSTLMVLDGIDMSRITKPENREGVLVGGNMCSWYGGFDSMVVAQEFDAPISIVSMGRKREEEEKYFPGVNYVNYKIWNEWIYELSRYKYAVHLMRTHAAGTFALNCAWLGIPCIGYAGLDTQEHCHSTTVDVGNLIGAKKIARKLKETNYYNDCSMDANVAVAKYTVDEFKYSMEQKFKQILGDL